MTETELQALAVRAEEAKCTCDEVVLLFRLGAEMEVQALTIREARTYEINSLRWLVAYQRQTQQARKALERNDPEAAKAALDVENEKLQQDAERLDWLESEARRGKVYTLAWYPREKSGWDEMVSYDIPAGFWYNDDDGGPYPSLRAAMDAAKAPTDSGVTP